MDKAAFIETVSPMAMKTFIDYGVPASITIAQAILESRWGDSKLTKKAKNYFGIRANKGYTGNTFNIDTGEYVNGNYIIDKAAAFRSYQDSQQSFTDHAEFLLNNKRYNHLFDNENPNDWATGLQKAGYSTSPDYASTLKTIIRQNGLTAFDSKAKELENVGTVVGKHYRRNRTLFIVGGSFVLLAAGVLTYKHYKRNAA